MNNPELFDLIKKLIVEGEFPKAMNRLQEERPLLKSEIEIIALLSRWHENEALRHSGEISQENYSLEKNKLRKAALFFANEILQDTTKANRETEPLEKSISIRNEAELEKIIGKNSLTRIEWYARMVEASKSVCRIQVKKPNGDHWKGTGFLTEGGYLFTNHHVLESAGDARHASVEFNYLNENQQPSVYSLDANTWAGDEPLDFARVKIVDKTADPLQKWGCLQIDRNAEVKPGDPLPIIQHPEGQVMQISIEGNFAERLSDDGKYVFYTTDTMPGSSGSPVFNKDWKVVALHHASMNGEDLNRGILFKAILDFLKKNGERFDLDDPAEPPQPPPPAAGPVKIFWMYDEEAAKYAADLKKYFAIITRKKEVEIFDMHRDIGTRETENVIADELIKSDLILCLVTPMFLFSTMPLAEEADNLKKPLVPVLMEETPIDDTVLHRFYSLPTKHKYVSAWPVNGSTLSAAYMDIYLKIKQYLDDLKKK
jgi:V8-like Glu-specific endopeptidase